MATLTGAVTFGRSLWGGSDQHGGSPVVPSTLAQTWSFPAPTIIATSGNATPTPATLKPTNGWNFPGPSILNVSNNSLVATVMSGLVMGWGTMGDGYMGFCSSGLGPLVFGVSQWGGVNQHGGEPGQAVTIGSLFYFPGPTVTGGSSSSSNATATPALLGQTWSYGSPTISTGSNATATPALLGQTWSFPAPVLPFATPKPAALIQSFLFHGPTISTGGAVGTPGCVTGSDLSLTSVVGVDLVLTVVTSTVEGC